MKVLVTGGREFNERERLFEVLGQLHAGHKITHLIHGGARGADTLAGEWARNVGVQEVRCDANWNFHGKAAGPIRNRKMFELLNYEDDLVVAFDGGNGTANMVSLVEEEGFDILYYQTKP